MNCRTATAALIVDAHSLIGEGPVWDGKNRRLIWVDIAAGLIHSFDPDSGVLTTHNVGQPVGSVTLCAAGGLIAAMRDGIALFRDDGEELARFVEVERDLVGSRMNDGKCDCCGRFWVGTMAVDHAPGCGTLYRVEQVDSELKVSAQLCGITISNGLDWSNDNRRMYYIDSATQRIDVFDFEAESGLVDNRRPFVVVPRSDGLPDGMTVDAEGYVWVALFGSGRVRRYSPGGEVDMEVQVPVTLVTSCMFGGRDLRDLYITTARHRLAAAEAAAQPTAGAVFVSRPGPQGRPPFLFGHS